MIIPSVDLQSSKAVQLVGGKELAVDAGDPRPIATKFGRIGEIAVIDLDAAMGTGDQTDRYHVRAWNAGDRCVFGTEQLPAVLSTLVVKRPQLYRVRVQTGERDPYSLRPGITPGCCDTTCVCDS